MAGRQNLVIGTGVNTPGAETRYQTFLRCHEMFGELYAGYVGRAVKTGNYTFVLTDLGLLIEGNSASPITFTIPLISSVPWPADHGLRVRQVGAGAITVAHAGGASFLKTPVGLTTRTLWSSLFLDHRGGDEWVVDGDAA